MEAKGPAMTWLTSKTRKPSSGSGDCCSGMILKKICDTAMRVCNLRKGQFEHFPGPTPPRSRAYRALATSPFQGEGDTGAILRRLLRRLGGAFAKHSPVGALRHYAFEGRQTRMRRPIWARSDCLAARRHGLRRFE